MVWNVRRRGSEYLGLRTMEMEVAGRRKRGRPRLGWKDRLKVVGASAKAQDRRLEWFGHVRRRGSEYLGLRTMEMEVAGRRKRGRPRLRWKDRLRGDMDERQMEEDQAMDRNVWRRLARTSDSI